MGRREKRRMKRQRERFQGAFGHSKVNHLKPLKRKRGMYYKDREVIHGNPLKWALGKF